MPWARSFCPFRACGAKLELESKGWNAQILFTLHRFIVTYCYTDTYALKRRSDSSPTLHPLFTAWCYEGEE